MKAPMRRLTTLLSLSVAFAGVATVAHADEGMWTYNNFPKQAVGKKYNFTPDDAWLKHVQMSSARIAGGCSASFVSPEGLVLTNHHCAHQCIAQLSTAQKDYVKSGYTAKTQADEVKCPEMEINQLVDIVDVTDKIRAATKGLDGEKFTAARKQAESAIEKEMCGGDAKLRCDVVTLYQGGVYNLYKYRRFQDVRLVFAPEFPIAFFGGDPDNFNFPRYDLDMSILRVYEDGKPAKMDHYLTWSEGGVKPGDLTFVSGHPGRTSRQLTVAQLEYQRDVALPERLMRLAEMRGMLTEFMKRGPEQKRIATDDLFGVENAFKALKGRYEALLDGTLMAKKRAEEEALKAKLKKKGAAGKAGLEAFASIEKAVKTMRLVHKPYDYIERGLGFGSDLFGFARVVVRGAEERPKPNGERLDEFRDAALPQLTQRLFSKKPIYDELETLDLTFALTKLREVLGADDPFVKKVLGKESPEEMAARLIKGTKLKDVAVRKALWDGGKAAVEASTDPMVVLARSIDAEARKWRKRVEDEVDSVYRKGGEQIAKARFEAQGTSVYPDATFTLRLSFGTVKGWTQDGKEVDPITVFGGAFDRATGRPPFDLPQSWLDAKARLNMKTPFNFCSTNDIIGGNSGSPVVNQKGELVGLIFDGNLPSLGGEYGFDESANRAVAVHSEGMLEALSKVYGAERIVNELRAKKTAAAK
jgi:hypothetical protein